MTTGAARVKRGLDLDRIHPVIVRVIGIVGAVLVTEAAAEAGMYVPLTGYRFNICTVFSLPCCVFVIFILEENVL